MSGVIYAFVANDKVVVTSEMAEYLAAKLNNPGLAVETFSSRDKAEQWAAKKAAKKSKPLADSSNSQDPRYLPVDIKVYVDYLCVARSRETVTICYALYMCSEYSGNKLSCGKEILDRKEGYPELCIITNILKKCKEEGNISVISESTKLAKEIRKINKYKDSSQCYAISDEFERTVAQIKIGQKRELNFLSSPEDGEEMRKVKTKLESLISDRS